MGTVTRKGSSNLNGRYREGGGLKTQHCTTSSEGNGSIAGQGKKTWGNKRTGRTVMGEKE